jgi:hypothetical protein
MDVTIYYLFDGHFTDPDPFIIVDTLFFGFGFFGLNGCNNVIHFQSGNLRYVFFGH